VLQAVAASGCLDVHLDFIAKEDQCAAEVVKRKLEVVRVFDTQWWARDWLTLDGNKANIFATEIDPDQIMQVLWSEFGVSGVACLDSSMSSSLCCFAQRLFPFRKQECVCVCVCVCVCCAVLAGQASGVVPDTSAGRRAVSERQTFENWCCCLCQPLSMWCETG